MSRLYLSPPDVGARERELLLEAFDSGWIAPVGPQLDAFEEELGAKTDRPHACALSSGTAALHLALIVLGVKAGDRVIVSTLTFAASANVIKYVGAEPVFIDCDAGTWNMDPDLLAEELEASSRRGQLPSAVMAVDLYGQCADYERIVPLCKRYGVPLIEDAAESLGATCGGRPAGSFGELAVLSFNGNKIITTSGGGALLGSNADWISKASSLSTQARDPAPHYQHSELGFNYRLSNLLAALGRAQLADLERRVARRREHNAAYRSALEGIDGLDFMPEAPGCDSTFWLTTLTVDPERTGTTRDTLRERLEARDMEARPVWKPMHLQPYYRDCETRGGDVSGALFENGLCLPSGSSMSDGDRERVVETFLEVLEG